MTAETAMADPVGRRYRLAGGDGLDAGRFRELVVAAVAALG